MIEKSLYENYQIDFDETITPSNDDYLFIFEDVTRSHNFF